MKPLAAFHHNIQSAEELVRLTELLSGKNERRIRKERAQGLRKTLHWSAKEKIDRSENKSLYIIIREAANIERSYFDAHKLQFLLRQSVVAACSAMDCYFLEKVEEKIWSVVSRKKKNAPSDLLKLRISVSDYLGAESYKRKGWALKAAMVESIRYLSFQSPSAIKDRLQLIGIRDFWREIDLELGVAQGETEKSLKALVSRRNQIVHEGDRPGNKHRTITVGWVKPRVQLVRKIVDGAEKVIDRQVADL